MLFQQTNKQNTISLFLKWKKLRLILKFILKIEIEIPLAKSFGVIIGISGFGGACIFFKTGKVSPICHNSASTLKNIFLVYQNYNNNRYNRYLQPILSLLLFVLK